MSEGDDGVVREIGKLLNEQPKIDGAVRNLLAMHLSVKKTFGESSNIHTFGADGSVVKLDEQELDVIELQKVAGTVLRSLNAMQVMEPLQWQEKNPQKEDQTGMNRLDQVIQYKSVHMLCKKSQEKGGKLSKTLGKTGLEILWPQLKPKIVENLEKAEMGKMTYIEKFLKDLVDFESDLVWAIDFQSALAQRHLDRKKEAEKRLAEGEPAVEEDSEV